MLFSSKRVDLRECLKGTGIGCTCVKKEGDEEGGGKRLKTCSLPRCGQRRRYTLGLGRSVWVLQERGWRRKAKE